MHRQPVSSAIGGAPDMQRTLSHVRLSQPFRLSSRKQVRPAEAEQCQRLAEGSVRTMGMLGGLRHSGEGGGQTPCRCAKPSSVMLLHRSRSRTRRWCWWRRLASDASPTCAGQSLDQQRYSVKRAAAFMRWTDKDARFRNGRRPTPRCIKAHAASVGSHCSRPWRASSLVDSATCWRSDRRTCMRAKQSYKHKPAERACQRVSGVDRHACWARPHR